MQKEEKESLAVREERLEPEKLRITKDNCVRCTKMSRRRKAPGRSLKVEIRSSSLVAKNTFQGK